MRLREFIDRHYRHFNAATVADAARAYGAHLDTGGRMMVTLAGAMSTAELGRSLAEMIRQEKVHAICCTGANLEEDLFFHVAHASYVRIPEWRELTADDERKLMDRGLARVTDTCIPEEAAMRSIEGLLLERWQAADTAGESKLPHEFFYDLIRSGAFDDVDTAPREDSWLIAACERDLPIFVPGWEDSTCGNVFAAACLRGQISRTGTVKGGIETMMALSDWFGAQEASVGFFQIGGGIAGDFPICVVPMRNLDLRVETPCWGYFCQIGDSTTSYGSYSGAVPNEKITWGKLLPDTPRFMIESDATIVAPLMFGYVLDW